MSTWHNHMYCFGKDILSISKKYVNSYLYVLTFSTSAEKKFSELNGCNIYFCDKEETIEEDVLLEYIRFNKNNITTLYIKRIHEFRKLFYNVNVFVIFISYCIFPV